MGGIVPGWNPGLSEKWELSERKKHSSFLVPGCRYNLIVKESETNQDTADLRMTV